MKYHSETSGRSVPIMWLGSWLQDMATIKYRTGVIDTLLIWYVQECRIKPVATRSFQANMVVVLN